MIRIVLLLFMCFIAQMSWGQRIQLGPNNRYGVIGADERLIFPYKYELNNMKILKSPAGEKIIGLKTQNKWLVFDGNGTRLTKMEFDDLGKHFSEGLWPVCRDKKWGYLDAGFNVAIEFQFDEANPFSEGLAAVKKGKWGYIDKTGKQIIPLKYAAAPGPFSEGLAWVREGRYYQYVDKTGKVVLSADYRTARTFSRGVAQVSNKADCFYIDRNGTKYQTYIEALKGIQREDHSAKDYASAGSAALSPKQRTVLGTVAAAPAGGNTQPPVAAAATTTARTVLTRQAPASAADSPEWSDVDSGIPHSPETNENTFAVIIANETYRRESSVDYALRDGEVFNQYCRNALGIPAGNIHYVPNATLNDIRAEIGWITKVAQAYKGEAKVIFYYAGHGIPDETTQSSYLLPVDGFGSDPESGYKLRSLYDNLASAPTVSTVVLLDACFSGAERSGRMLASARGVAIKAKPETPKGSVLVFSAARNDETAYPYKEKRHGMFTYFLLKKLKETGGNATMGELVEYVTDCVCRRSIVDNSKSQTPSVIPSSGLAAWEEIRLR